MYVQQIGVVLLFEIQVDVLCEVYGIICLCGIMQYDDLICLIKIEYNDVDKVCFYVWVNLYFGEVFGFVVCDEMLMCMLCKFYGELFLGKIGIKFVEFVVYWFIVMFIIGVYFWWFCGKCILLQVVVFLKGGLFKGCSWWCEMYLFIGFFVVVLVMLIFVSGLFWIDVWGGGFSQI